MLFSGIAFGADKELEAPKTKKDMQKMLQKTSWELYANNSKIGKIRFTSRGEFSPKKVFEKTNTSFKKWDIGTHGKDGQAFRLQMHTASGYHTYLWNKELQAWTHHGKKDSSIQIRRKKK